ncbi:hypothetical protein QCA50_016363 [Cerrena zonata]|uniref:Uncharacterized protein n=1 Tax=Cerrena zonata TaxID=2478898 RepID=A0AAW0FT77_9APHY
MMNLIAARAPSLALFGSIQVAMWSFVWSQWHQQGHINTPLKSAIPTGHIGRGRYSLQDHAYA